MTTLRRHDIDWLRVLAIGLLLIYHAAIAFQPWGIMIGFITSRNTWEGLWIPMTMVNVWRIPLLFFVSGMGVFFAIQNRNWKELLYERAVRIGIPFLVGVFFIVPVSALLSQYYYQGFLTYAPSPGHLWFLGNILVYVLVLSPFFFYLKLNENSKLVIGLKVVLSNLPGLLIVFVAFVTEVLVVKPALYEWYAMTWHGFFLGLLAFFFGFCFVLTGDRFWKMIEAWRWLFISAAVLLYAWRQVEFPLPVPGYRLSIESNCWILAVLAFAYKYLNRPSNMLDYLSRAAYPVYILHMIFLSLGSKLIFPLDIPVFFQFIFLLLFTFGGSFTTYEFLIRRISFIRLLFGVKVK